MRSPLRWNTNGQIVPAAVSCSWIANCAVRIFSRSAVNGNTRPSLFFVVCASRRTQRPGQSTCRHSRGNTSEAVRQSGGVGEPDDVRQLARPLARVRGRLGGFQRRTDALDLIPIEEAAPRVPFFQHREVRAIHQPTGLHSQIERPAQCGEFAVDLGCLGPPVLPLGDEAPDVSSTDARHAATFAKVRQEMDRDFAPHVAEGRPRVRLVVSDQIVGRRLERQRSDRRFGRDPAILGAEALAEQLLGLVAIVAMRRFQPTPAAKVVVADAGAEGRTVGRRLNREEDGRLPLAHADTGGPV
jgi:hypothetical protein